jgi:hypothetical protein
VYWLCYVLFPLFNVNLNQAAGEKKSNGRSNPSYFAADITGRSGVGLLNLRQSY